MRAAVLKGARSVVVEDPPEPQILADQAMVRGPEPQGSVARTCTGSRGGGQISAPWA